MKSQRGFSKTNADSSKETFCSTVRDTNWYKCTACHLVIPNAMVWFNPNTSLHPTLVNHWQFTQRQWGQRGLWICFPDAPLFCSHCNANATSLACQNKCSIYHGEMWLETFIWLGVNIYFDHSMYDMHTKPCQSTNAFTKFSPTVLFTHSKYWYICTFYSFYQKSYIWNYSNQIYEMNSVWPQFCMYLIH